MTQLSTPLPRTRYARWWLVGLGTVGIAGLLTYAFDRDPATVTVVPNHAHLSDTVSDGNLTFTITDLEADVPAITASDEFTVVPQNAYTLIQVTVGNIGTEPVRYFAEYVTATVADGGEIPTDYIATMYVNEGNDAWISEIEPGQVMDTIVVFDTDEPVTAVVLRADADSHGVAVEL